MENIVMDSPNLVKPETVPVKEASNGLDAIAAKMAAMRNLPQRNPLADSETAGTGEPAVANAETPVAPSGIDDNDTDLIQPEVAEPDAEYIESDDDVADAPDAEVEVSSDNTSPGEIIDFLEFAESNPNAKFRFKRNGKEIEIDAKKAASILGQGAAISEEARQLKVERAEFDEFLQAKRAEQEGLVLAMQFTVQPQIQKAYDEIIKVQEYQNQFAQQLAQTNDPAQQARIQANMQQNERYIQQQSSVIQSLQPRIQEFYNFRRNQVNEVLESNRRAFKDKDLRNKAIYEDVLSKVAEGWEGAKNQLVPGIDNINLVASDEHILSLLRDGIKFRNKPKTKQAGASVAALTTRRAGTQISGGRGQDELTSLREKARGGDTKAADNLLMAHMKALRARR